MDTSNMDTSRNSFISTCRDGSCKVDAIIFDLGNVLLDFDHRIACQRISKFTPLETIGKQGKDKMSLTGFIDKDEREIFNLFFDSGLTALFEEGKISPLQFFSKVKEILSFKLDYDQFVPIWNEIFFFTEENFGVYNLAYNLRSRYKVTVLSNINILHFEYIKRTFPILDAFPNIITSFELGFRKPHALIYQKTLEILKTSPQNVFYTDDRNELVESANQLGIRSFVFKGVEQLKTDLLESGIDIK